MIIRSFYSSSRYHFYKGPEFISESDWREYDADVTRDSEAPMVTLDRFIKRFANAVKTGEGRISDAYWRMTAQMDSGDVVVLTPVPLRQGVDEPKVDEIRLRFLLNTGIKLAETPQDVTIDTADLPALDATPVPTGTVVEVLDEWGLPTGSTEVT